jgi:hypothetical protein
MWRSSSDQHMGRDMVNRSFHRGCIPLSKRRRIVLLVMTGVLTACHSAKLVTDDQNAQLLLQQEQQNRGLVIGQDYHGHLEYFDASMNFGSRSSVLPVDVSVQTSKLDIPLAEQKTQSSNGVWDVECHKTHCIIGKHRLTSVHFSIERDRLLTPIYWSPDESFGFYILNGPTWRTPSRCSMEDERDIVLVDSKSGKQGVVKTVCGGFPYDQLRWFVLPSKPY